MNKKLPVLVILTSLAAAVAFTVASPETARAGGYCDKFEKFAKIKDACTKGANDEGKMRDQMKAWQKTAKGKGGDYKCTTCHEKGKGGPLNSDGASKWADFEKLL